VVKPIQPETSWEETFCFFFSAFFFGGGAGALQLWIELVSGYWFLKIFGDLKKGS
jgi:hypothetical protein